MFMLTPNNARFAESWTIEVYVLTRTQVLGIIRSKDRTVQKPFHVALSGGHLGRFFVVSVPEPKNKSGATSFKVHIPTREMMGAKEDHEVVIDQTGLRRLVGRWPQSVPCESKRYYRDEQIVDIERGQYYAKITGLDDSVVTGWIYDQDGDVISRGKRKKKGSGDEFRVRAGAENFHVAVTHDEHRALHLEFKLPEDVRLPVKYRNWMARHHLTMVHTGSVGVPKKKS